MNYRKWILVIVAIALLLDNMLLTTVGISQRYPHGWKIKWNFIVPVPIIPQFIYELRQQNEEVDKTTTTASGNLTGNETIMDPSLRKHLELVNENQEVGVLFAAKAFVQLIANPFVGKLTNR